MQPEEVEVESGRLAAPMHSFLPSVRPAVQEKFTSMQPEEVEVESERLSCPGQLPPIEAEDDMSSRPTQLSQLHTERPREANGRCATPVMGFVEGRGTNFGGFPQDGTSREYVPILVRSGEMSSAEIEAMVMTEIECPRERRSAACQGSFRRKRFAETADGQHEHV